MGRGFLFRLLLLLGNLDGGLAVLGRPWSGFGQRWACGFGDRHGWRGERGWRDGRRRVGGFCLHGPVRSTLFSSSKQPSVAERVNSLKPKHDMPDGGQFLVVVS